MKPAALVLTGGFAAGSLDIAFACVFWRLKAGLGAERVLQSVAAGLMGKESFAGGAAAAGLGLVLHFAIATAMALAYYLVARQWPLLCRQAVACGIVYGLMLYGVMNFIVVPLSAAPPGSQDPLWIATSIVAHVALVGVPIALIGRRGFD